MFLEGVGRVRRSESGEGVSTEVEAVSRLTRLRGWGEGGGGVKGERVQGMGGGMSRGRGVEGREGRGV